VAPVHSPFSPEVQSAGVVARPGRLHELLPACGFTDAELARELRVPAEPPAENLHPGLVLHVPDDPTDDPPPF
jgi:hypothetical protein